VCGIELHICYRSDMVDRLDSMRIGAKVSEWRTRPRTQEVQEDKTHLFAQIANALEGLCHNACFHSLPPLPHPGGTTYIGVSNVKAYVLEPRHTLPMYSTLHTLDPTHTLDATHTRPYTHTSTLLQ
jgi:hypothetical protein